MKRTYFFILILSIFLSIEGYAQNGKFSRDLDSNYYKSILDSLQLRLGTFKDFPPSIQLQLFTTLSYFPELDSSKIIFKSAQIKTTMNARPMILSCLLHSKKNRKYVIRINNKVCDSIIDFYQAPFNAQIGLMGHEFCHILDYNSMSIWKLLKLSISYKSKKGKIVLENKIDRMTISKGLGWQVYDWSDFVLNNSNASELYKNYKRRIYLKPNEIKEIIYSDERY